jgi:hypothetical protein
MTPHRHAKLAVKALIGVSVLLASGAASATTTQAGSPVSSEVQRLQATWGAPVVVTAAAVPDSHLIIIGTRDRGLLSSAHPQHWLGSRFPVMLMYVHPSGLGFKTQMKCGFGAHMTTETTAM